MRDVGTLLEALPYIREFHGKTVVIKYGGAAMTDPALKEEFARDVVLLKYVGHEPGGRPRRRPGDHRLHEAARPAGGVRRRPARVATPTTVEVAKMVLVGKVNKDIVLRINRHGQPAVGLCGDDGLLFRAAARPAPERPGHRLRRPDRARRRRRAQPRRRRTTSRSSRRVGADREGNSYNINADEAAGAVARALGAYKVMFLTDVAGLAARPRRPGQRRSPRRGADEVEAALRRDRRRHAAQARRPAWTRSTAA